MADSYCLYLLNSYANTWQVQIPKKLTKITRRFSHSAVSVSISSECTKVILFGGKRRFGKEAIADTAVLRFGK